MFSNIEADSKLKVPSEAQGKSVGEIVISWNTELESRTNFFLARTKGLTEWDSCIQKNKHILSALQIDLARVTSSQDRLERQLEILQLHQQEVDEALTIMESVAEQLGRTQHPTSGSSPQQTRTRHETIFNLAESVSASLSALGSALRHVTPSVYMAPAESVCIHSCGKSSDSCFEFTQDNKNCSIIKTQAHSFSDKILKAHLQTVLSVERKALQSQQLF
ncbi:structural constituent of nuclear pore [Micromonas commoda]|uniref:Structural constituent of nuclear pore n=1 Tax=Micromonas commoda (strain RCC299 / NOUM17 / CCMP2709) TaxID=296587 RepID=C1FDF9_MICCC|nr:structural constituent of nuclear pore [Micromonas commoda]ACO68382.1 structural constituent of nuclear pore [Micromonas commoda]|eukprot:XP_002507124.1 structural constituent of nuclear pore [Micromonas commoda]